LATTDKNQKQLAALPLWRRAAILFVNTLRWVFRTFIAVLTFVIASLFLISAFSDWFSPDFWTLSAYMGLFFPAFALLILGWLVFLLVAHRWKQVIFVILVLLVGSERLWRYCPLHIGQQEVLTALTHDDGEILPIDVDSLKILTYNTHTMGGIRLPDVKTPVKVFDIVRQSGADIVCLQEYAFSKSPKGHSETDLRKRLSDIYPYYGFVTNKGQTAMGVAMFSKYPILKYEKIDEDQYQGAIAYAEVDFHGRSLALVNCYMQSFQIPNAEREFMNEMGKKFETDSIARLEKGLRNLSRAFRARAKQSLQVRDYLVSHKELASKPLLVLGDMNDTPISFTYNKLRDDLSDTWVEAGFGPGISFRMFPFWFRIDHIFHSSHLRALDIKVLRDAKQSDHYPVFASYQLLPE